MKGLKFGILVIVLILVLVLTGCGEATTVTFTSPAKTVTNVSTETKIVPSLVVATVTAPGATVTTTSTVTSPPVTYPPVTTVVTTPSPPNTITQTTTTTHTVTTTLPPVTVTLTPTTPVIPPTVGNSIEASLQVMGTNTIDATKSGAQATYYILSYKNTANVAFSNVKFKIIFYTSLPTNGLLSYSLTIIAGTMPTSTVWVPSVIDNIYTFSSLQGVNIAANTTNGELDLIFLVTLKDSSILPLPSPPVTPPVYTIWALYEVVG